jgi:hypothetical protein
MAVAETKAAAQCHAAHYFTTSAPFQHSCIIKEATEYPCLVPVVVIVLVKNQQSRKIRGKLDIFVLVWSNHGHARFCSFWHHFPRLFSGNLLHSSTTPQTIVYT